MSSDSIYQLSEEEYHERIRDLSMDLVDEIRQKIYNRVYGIIAQHTDEPDEYDSLVNDLVNDCIRLIKDSL